MKWLTRTFSVLTSVVMSLSLLPRLMPMRVEKLSWINSKVSAQSSDETRVNAVENILPSAQEKRIINEAEYSCAALSDGTLYCWGYEAGNSPVTIMEDAASYQWYHHAAGSFHSVIRSDGSLYTWGHNHCGICGNGTQEDVASPEKIMQNVRSFYVMSMGSQCAAITSDGGLYAWGYNYKGWFAGNDLNEYVYSPVRILDDVVKFYYAETSLTYAALTKDGSLYSWGFNDHGQLGDGTTLDHTTPIKVLENVADASLCDSRMLAITTNGDLYAWGNNGAGNLGNGTREDCHTPVKIMENVKMADECMCLTMDGDLYTWGTNDYGQIGDGTTQDSLVPVKIMEHVKDFGWGITSNNYAVTEDNSLYVWGSYKRNYIIGNGTKEGSLVPVKILDHVAKFRPGDIYAAITEDGDLYMWGENSSGICANGTTEEVLSPEKIMSNITDFRWGTDGHAAALTVDGELYTWGRNNSYDGRGNGGFLGDGTTDDRYTPLKILEGVTELCVMDNTYWKPAILDTSSAEIRTKSNPFVMLITGDTSIVKDRSKDYSEISILSSIRPWGGKPIQNAYREIVLPDHMELDRDVLGEKAESDVLYASEINRCTWKIRVSNSIAPGVYPIYVKYGAKGYAEKKQRFDVIVLNEAVDNRIIFGQDNFSFKNDQSSFRFTNNSKSGYLTKENENEVINELARKYSNRVYSLLKTDISRSRDGLCHGMSTVAAVNKAGYDGSPLLAYLDQGILETADHESCLYNVKKPKYAPEVGKFIYYYFLQQYLPDTEEIKFNSAMLGSNSIMLKQLVDSAGKVKSGGIPVCIGAGSHSILAYDVSKGSFVQDGTTYRYQISILDPNKSTEQFAYVTEDYRQFYYGEVIDSVTVFSALNQICQEDSHGNSRSLLKDYSYDIVQVYYKNTGAYDILGGDENVLTKVGTYGEDEEDDDYVHDCYMSPDLSGEITVKPTAEDTELSAAAVISDYVVEARSDQCREISFSENGEVSLHNGSNANYYVQLSAEAFADIPWFAVSVEGSGAGNVRMQKTDGKIVLESDDLSTCIITAFNKEEEVAVALTTDQNAVEITADGDVLAVYADSNQDGSFDQLVADSEHSAPPEQSLGDVNSDGSINASDAAQVLIAAAKLGTGNSSGLSYEAGKAADVNVDGTINAKDANTILRYAAAVGTGAKAKIADFV